MRPQAVSNRRSADDDPDWVRCQIESGADSRWNVFLTLRDNFKYAVQTPAAIHVLPTAPIASGVKAELIGT